MRFGRKNQKRHTSPDTITFHLLHLSILREYLEHEFSSLKVRGGRRRRRRVVRGRERKGGVVEGG